MTSTLQKLNGNAVAFDGVEHAERISADVARLVKDKYLAGQREHGGVLLEKAGLLGHAENEAHDLEIYHHAIREKLDGIRIMAVHLVTELNKLLGTPEN